MLLAGLQETKIFGGKLHPGLYFFWAIFYVFVTYQKFIVLPYNFSYAQVRIS